MRIIETRRELQSLADSKRAAGRRLALVPTMGALHAGHVALIREAHRHADLVAVSIYVNPTQFNDPADLDRYPDRLEEDLTICEAEGVAVVYAPRPGEVYPEGDQTWVDVAELSLPLCGRDRPGHFRGVTTVVTKLFLAARPHVAVFGEKDFQQLAVVRRLVRDLGFDLEVVGVPIVREEDGVALSSRNLNLDDDARRQAVVLYRALEAAERAVAAGENRAGALLEIARREIGKAPRAEIDYCELRDPASLEPSPDLLRDATLLALAVQMNAPDGSGDPSVRLIDNRVLHPSAQEVSS